jgi:Fe-S-cluster containining protein
MSDDGGKPFISPEDTWFAEGLRFKCTGCGKCCTGASGSVYLSQEDLERLAAHFKLAVGAFVRQYTRMRNGRRALLDNVHSQDCIFLKGKACTVYDARPVQCRTYPWWFSNLREPEDWQEERALCEGIDHPSAPVIPAAEILEQAQREADNDSHGRH